MSGFGFWETLSLLGAIHGFFLGFVLWTQGRGNRVANRILGTLVVLYSFHLLNIVLYWTRALAAVPHLFGTAWFLPYLYGVLLFLYTGALLEPDVRVRRAQAVHLIPFVLSTLLFSRFYLLPADVKRRILEASFEQTSASPGPLALTIWGLQFVHFAAYLAACGRRLRAVRSDPATVHWLRRLLAAFSVSFSLWFLYGFSLSLGVPYTRAIDYGATLAMTVSIYALGYVALRTPELFVGELGRSRNKYQGSALDEAELRACQERLVEVMDSIRPHARADLRLRDLAGLVGVSPHQLSQVINRAFGLRFNDFVNRYRVEEAKRLLSDPARKDESLLSLAYEAGFNNKTSFNQAFKRHTDMTPSRFRDEVSRQTL